MACTEPVVKISLSENSLHQSGQKNILEEWWKSDRPDTPEDAIISTIDVSKSTRIYTNSEEMSQGPLLWQSYNLPLPAVLLEPQRWMMKFPCFLDPFDLFLDSSQVKHLSDLSVSSPTQLCFPM